MVQMHRWYSLSMDAWRKRSEQFLKNLNEFDPCVKFTYDSNKENIVFLEIKVSLVNGKVFTDLKVKPTDYHKYLHCFSAQPYHTKISVVFNQNLCISKDFKKRIKGKGVTRTSD